MRALELKPPLLDLSPEVEWLLLRAFAPPRLAAPRVDAERALALTRRLGLGSRIAGRIPDVVLQADLGESASALGAERWTTAAADALLLAALGLVQRAAERAGAPLVGLKFVALRALGLAQAGQRRANDVDVLTPRSLALPLRRELLARGCTEPGVRGYEHQLAPVISPEGVPIEIHLHIPGVRLPGSRRFAHAGELLSAGLLDATRELTVPSIEIVTAHTLAHALLQNAGTPASHSLLCALADLSDILTGHPGALEGAVPYLGERFDEEDARATGELVRALVRGDVSRALAGGGGVLLRHALAARLDAHYASALRLRLLTRPLSDRPYSLALATALKVALFPTARELEISHGARLSRPAVIGRRLLRPMDLAWRLAAAVISSGTTAGGASAPWKRARS